MGDRKQHLQFRAATETVEEIDQFANEQNISRSEACRRFLDSGRQVEQLEADVLAGRDEIAEKTVELMTEDGSDEIARDTVELIKDEFAALAQFTIFAVALLFLYLVGFIVAVLPTQLVVYGLPVNEVLGLSALFFAFLATLYLVLWAQSRFEDFDELRRVSSR